MSLQLKDKDVMLDNIKCFAQIQGDDVSCTSLIYQCCNPITVGGQIFQELFAPSEAMLALTNHYLPCVPVAVLHYNILSLLSC